MSTPAKETTALLSKSKKESVAEITTQLNKETSLTNRKKPQSKTKNESSDSALENDRKTTTDEVEKRQFTKKDFALHVGAFYGNTLPETTLVLLAIITVLDMVIAKLENSDATKQKSQRIEDYTNQKNYPIYILLGIITLLIIYGNQKYNKKWFKKVVQTDDLTMKNNPVNPCKKSENIIHDTSAVLLTYGFMTTTLLSVAVILNVLIESPIVIAAILMSMGLAAIGPQLGLFVSSRQGKYTAMNMLVSIVTSILISSLAYTIKYSPDKNIEESAPTASLVTGLIFLLLDAFLIGAKRLSSPVILIGAIKNFLQKTKQSHRDSAMSLIINADAPAMSKGQKTTNNSTQATLFKDDKDSVTSSTIDIYDAKKSEEEPVVNNLGV